MASIFDALLDPDETLTDPAKRQATAAALRRQNAMGVVGQLMGLEPTQRAGSMLQELECGIVIIRHPPQGK